MRTNITILALALALAGSLSCDRRDPCVDEISLAIDQILDARVEGGIDPCPTEDTSVACAMANASAVVFDCGQTGACIDDQFAAAVAVRWEIGLRNIQQCLDK